MLICDFHREQAWERWLSKVSNGCSHIKQEVLAKLRRIAHAITEEECEAAIQSLRQWEIWKHSSYSKLVDYVERYWFKEKKASCLIVITYFILTKKSSVQVRKTDTVLSRKFIQWHSIMDCLSKSKVI